MVITNSLLKLSIRFFSDHHKFECANFFVTIFYMAAERHKAILIINLTCASVVCFLFQLGKLHLLK